MAVKFPPSAIIKRKPLSSAARRAGWVGCNFALNRIPADARIAVVTESRVTPEAEVRRQFRHIKPLKDIPVQMRGWTLDVLNIVRRISEVGTARCAVRAPSGRKIPAALPPGTSQRNVPTNTFTTADAYAFTRELEKLHPDNRHVKDKIRQQLQVLRDAGLLLHIGRGIWRLP